MVAKRVRIPNFHRNAALAVQTQNKVVQKAFALLPHLLTWVLRSLPQALYPYVAFTHVITNSSIGGGRMDTQYRSRYPFLPVAVDWILCYPFPFVLQV